MSDLSYVRNNDGTYSKLVQLSGRNVTVSENVYTNVSVGAGVELNVGTIDLSDAARATFVAIDSINTLHTFSVGQRARMSSATTSLTPGPALVASGGSPYAKTTFAVESEKYYFYIKNNDTVSRTYNCHVYKMRA